MGTPAEIRRRVQELLEIVGLSPEHYNRFPHEFSGGQRQRIGVAPRPRRESEADHLRRAGPRRSTVSVSAQILNLLKDLQRDFGSYLRLHRARPERGQAHLGSRARDVPRANRRAGIARRALRRAAQSTYSGALLAAVPRAIRIPRSVAPARARPLRAGRRRPRSPNRPTGRMSLPTRAVRDTIRACATSRRPSCCGARRAAPPGALPLPPRAGGR